jgi:hypothetical protein
MLKKATSWEGPDFSRADQLPNYFILCHPERALAREGSAFAFSAACSALP